MKGARARKLQRSRHRCARNVARRHRQQLAKSTSPARSPSTSPPPPVSGGVARNEPGWVPPDPINPPRPLQLRAVGWASLPVRALYAPTPPTTTRTHQPANATATRHPFRFGEGPGERLPALLTADSPAPAPPPPQSPTTTAEYSHRPHPPPATHHKPPATAPPPPPPNPAPP